MKERPILFSAAMVRALLAGTKTQTRRVMKPQPCSLGDVIPYARCPYGQPGDRLWVRETHYVEPHPSAYGITREMIPQTWDQAVAAAGAVHYRADPMSEWAIDGRRWTPSIHMPRWASRIDLEVTGVRVERLQDISEADAQAEGVDPIREKVPTYCDAYRYLWDDINGPGSWDANPFVWVVEFRRVKP